MNEQGTVTEITGNIVKIRLMQKSECAKCNLCTAEEPYRILKLKTDKPLKLNQIVSIEINQGLLMLSSLLLYILPLIALIAGAVFGYIIGKEILAVILGLAFLIADYFAAKIVVKNMRMSEGIAKIVYEI